MSGVDEGSDAVDVELVGSLDVVAGLSLDVVVLDSAVDVSLVDVSLVDVSLVDVSLR